MPTLGPPPTIEQAGNSITIHADIAWFEGAVPDDAKCLSGTVLSGRETLRASTDGVGPIVWQLPPGEYTIKAYGYPVDRMDPMRASATFAVSIVSPDRIQRLTALLLEFSQRLYQYEMVCAEILELAPTREELSRVLDVTGITK